MEFGTKSLLSTHLRILHGEDFDEGKTDILLTAVFKVVQHKPPSLNTQSCNRRPLCSTFIFENVRSPNLIEPVLFQKKKLNLKMCVGILLI